MHWYYGFSFVKLYEYESIHRASIQVYFINSTAKRFPKNTYRTQYSVMCSYFILGNAHVDLDSFLILNKTIYDTSSNHLLFVFFYFIS